MDCSEALIWSSPDLSLKPTTMVLLDGVYVASRKGHDIKYIFSTNNNNSTLDIREHIFSFMVPGIRQKRTTFGTKVLLASIAVIMIFVVLALLKIVYKEEVITLISNFFFCKVEHTKYTCSNFWVKSYLIWTFFSVAEKIKMIVSQWLATVVTLKSILQEWNAGKLSMGKSLTRT